MAQYKDIDFARAGFVSDRTVALAQGMLAGFILRLRVLSFEQVRCRSLHIRWSRTCGSSACRPA